jgi:hypothetical protein
MVQYYIIMGIQQPTLHHSINLIEDSITLYLSQPFIRVMMVMAHLESTSIQCKVGVSLLMLLQHNHIMVMVLNVELFMFQLLTIYICMFMYLVQGPSI